MRNEPKPDRHLLSKFRHEPIRIPVIEVVETFSVTIATAGGDEMKLRGIPVVGGAAGAIRGTVPHLIAEKGEAA